MANHDLKIYADCGRCLGTGVRIGVEVDADGNPVIEDPCVVCGGSGCINFGTLSSNSVLSRILNDLKQIKKKLDIEED